MASKRLNFDVGNDIFFRLFGSDSAWVRFCAFDAGSKFLREVFTPIQHR